MNAPDPERIDPRRPVDRYLGSYAEDHRHCGSRFGQRFCVPAILWLAILWSVIALLWVLPVPAAMGRPGLWAALAAVLAMNWYLRLSIKLGLAMLAAFVLLFAFTWWLHGQLGSSTLMWSAIGVFVIAWIGGLNGRPIEGKRPSLRSNLLYPLVGPLWLLSRFLRRLRVSY